MKLIAVRKELSYFFANSDEIESCVFDEKLEQLNLAIEALLHEYGLKRIGSYVTYVGLKKYSIGNCENCGSLMVNRDMNPTGFSESYMAKDLENGIVNGGEHKGKLLCEECLPITHRWGHHS